MPSFEASRATSKHALVVKNSQMLHVVGISGDELACLSAQSWQGLSVRALKQQLEPTCGATRFRQRLVRDGSMLTDNEELLVPGTTAAVELQHIVLPFCVTAPRDVEVLLRAIRLRNSDEVERILQQPLDPNENEPQGLAPEAPRV